MGLWEDYRNETGESPYIEMTLYEGEIEDFISYEYADWLERKVKKLEAELISLREENERLIEALEHIADYWNGGNESAVDAIEHAIETVEEAINAEQGGE